MYFPGTNIISKIRRTEPHGAVVARLKNTRDEDLHISSVTIGEIRAGIEITRGQDAAKAGAIEAWLDQEAASYNMLRMDARVLSRLARLMHKRSDNMIEDAMIAATAPAHKPVIVTRNIRGFEAFGVPVLDPFVGRG